MILGNLLKTFCTVAGFYMSAANFGVYYGLLKPGDPFYDMAFDCVIEKKKQKDAENAKSKNAK